MSGLRGGERRPVTTLFADIVGSTTLAERMDPEEWSEVVGEAVRRMANAVTRYEGRVEQVLGDGILAFFGLPSVHEDDPERAVRASLDVVDEMRRYSDETETSLGIRLPVRVGVSTGTVVLRDFGSAAAQTELTALGDPVNIAARLQAEARPDTVLVTAETHAFVAAATESRHVGHLTLKGKRLSVDTYEIVRWIGGLPRPRGVAGLRSPIVGRDAELATLTALLAPVRAGLGRAAIILGDPGIGKSRLIAELRQAAAAVSPAFAWREARCVSYGQNVPYHLVIDLVRSLLGLPAAELGSNAVFEANLGTDGHADIDRYLAHLLGLEVLPQAAAEIALLDGAVLQGRYVEALRSAIVAAGPGPAVVVCEDIHWADTASVELLARLAPQLRALPVLLLVVARPDRDVPGWSLVTSVRDLFGDVLVELRLGPLTRSDSRALVGNLLEIESLPESTREYILSRADGNPFFIEEVIRTLVDRGAIERRDERWVATRTIEAGEIPETLHGLLQGRIDRLPTDARGLLRVAAVIGRRFPLGVLKDVMARQMIDGRDLLPSLGHLEGAGMIELASVEPDLEYIFRHVLIQEAAYESLLRHDRRLLHRAVAESMESLFPDDLDELAPVIGMHFDAADDSARAVEYLVRAGRLALARFANHEAKKAFDRASALVGAAASDVETRRLRAEIDLGRAEAGRTFMPVDENLAILASVLGDAEARGDVRLLGRTYLLMAHERTLRGEQYTTSGELREALERGLEVAHSTGEATLRAEPLALLGQAKYRGAEYQAAIDLLQEALPLLEASGRLDQASLFGGTLASAHARLGHFDAAIEWVELATNLARRSGDSTAIIDADLARGEVEAARGNRAQAIDYASRAASEADRVDNKACALVARFIVGEQWLLLGQPDKAIGALAESADLAAFCDMTPVLVEFTGALLDSARQQAGGPAGSPDRIDRALELARQTGDRFHEGVVLRHRARERLRREGPTKASLADFSTAEAVFRQIEARPELAATIEEHAAAVRSAGRTSEAEALVGESAALRASMGLVG